MWTFDSEWRMSSVFFVVLVIVTDRQVIIRKETIIGTHVIISNGTQVITSSVIIRNGTQAVTTTVNP